MFLVNFLSIHSVVCLEPALSVRGWICVTPKIMSRCSVTFVSHEYISAFLERLLRVTDELIEMAQYLLERRLLLHRYCFRWCIATLEVEGAGLLVVLVDGGGVG